MKVPECFCLSLSVWSVGVQWGRDRQRTDTQLRRQAFLDEVTAKGHTHSFRSLCTMLLYNRT